jgi:sugar lactone lactonase YvrE
MRQLWRAWTSLFRSSWTGVQTHPVVFFNSASRVLQIVLLTFVSTAAFAQQPRIDSLNPSRGPIAGGSVVTIHGANLGSAEIRLDRAVITPLSRADSEVRMEMPRHDNGIVVISARNASGTAYAEFLYVPPRLDELPPGFITTVAGIGSFTRDYGEATKATLLAPWMLSFDRSGQLHVGDAQAGKVYRFTATGIIERVAGGGTGPEPGEGGPATEAFLQYPRGAAFDDNGNMYLGSNDCRLLMVNSAGIVSAFAGDGTCGLSGDGGPAAQARIGSPTFVAADHDDLFFIDFAYTPPPGVLRDSVRIRRVHLSDGRISTFAGNGTIGYSGDGGPATQASFDFGPRGVDGSGLVLDPQGNVYIIDEGNFCIRQIDRQTGIITTFYKPSTNRQDPDYVNDILAIAFDAGGNLYYSGAGRIVKVSSAKQFLTAWGNGSYGLPVDGVPAANAPLGHVIGLAIDVAGNIHFSDDAINRVRRIDIVTGLLETVAGIGPQIIGENGPAIATTAAMSTEGSDLAIAPTGELIVGDAGAFRIRRLERDGTLKTIGGTGGAIGSFGDNVPATSASMYPVGIYVDASGAIDTTERGDFKHIEPTGLMKRLRAQPDCSYAGDGGDMREAGFCQAWDVVRDSNGNLFIADTNNNRIRRVDAQTNVVTTWAGNGGPINGFEHYGLGQRCGDGGPAIEACFNTPYGVTFDDLGNLYVAEMFDIRRIDSAGSISTFASLNSGFPTKVRFFHGFLYSAFNAVVYRWDRSGTRSIVAGGGDGTFLGDGGPALAAKAITGGQADGVTVDPEGNLYFVDTGNRRIRAVRYGAVLAPAGAVLRAERSGNTIRATAVDEAGKPLESVRINFAAPSSGATCLLSNSFAITDHDGVARSTCTPNCIGGDYAVTATMVNASPSASTTFSNADKPCRRRAARH